MPSVSTPTGRLAALALVMLLPSLGTSIANVALPSLATAFNASFQDVQWVVIGYLLAVTSLIVGAGRLGDLIGRRRALLIGIGLFAVASVGCALSPTVWSLVLMRALQGAGAAFMMSLTMASVGDMVAPERTGRAIGLLGTVSAVGTALGPSLGGALISAFGWPSVFVVLTVTSLGALLFGFLTFPTTGSAERRPQGFDVPGTLLLVVSLGAYALATTAGNVALLLVALAGLVAFILVEHRAGAPLVQLGLLRDPTLSGALAAPGLVSAVVMSTLIVGPFYLRDGLGLSPLATGLSLTIGPAVAAISGFPAGHLVDRFGPRKATFAGLLALILGSVLMAALPAPGVAGYGLNLAVITAGYALFQAANNTTIMARAPQSQRGLVSGLLGLSRNLGLITGASAISAVFAFGSRGIRALNLEPGPASGLQVTFAVAALLGATALLLSLWSSDRANARR
jgi:MFS family permease